MNATISRFERELCPDHLKLRPTLRSPSMDGISASGVTHWHTAVCLAIEKLCGQDRSKQLFLLQRLEALRRYREADPYARWSKEQRKKLDRAIYLVLSAARSLDRCEKIVSKLEKDTRDSLPHVLGLSVNVRNYGRFLQNHRSKTRLYFLNHAQNWILANIVHRFQPAACSELAVALTEVLERRVTRKAISGWCKTHEAFINSHGPEISLR